MEARIRRLFSSRSSTSDFKSHSYEHAIPQQPPVRGSFPIAGNTPSLKAHSIPRGRSRTTAPQPLTSSEAAPAPDIPRIPRLDPREARWQAGPHRLPSPRPRTASAADVASNRANSGRTFSGFSMKNAPNLLRKRGHSSSQTSRPAPTSLERYSTHTRNKSSYVDIIAASSLREHASGRRNYGEDVADRNLEAHSRGPSESALNFDSSEIGYLRAVYLRNKGEHPLAWDHVQEGEEEYDVHRPYHNSPLTPHALVTKISSDGRANMDRSMRTQTPKASHTGDQDYDPNSIFVTTHKTSSISTYQHSMKPPIVPTYSYQPPDKPPLPTRSPARSLRTYSINSTTSRGRASTMRETMRDGPSLSKRTPNKSFGDSSQGSGQAAQSATRDKLPSPSHGDSNATEGTAVIAATAATAAVTNRPQAVPDATQQTFPLAASRSVVERKHPYPQPSEQQATNAIIGDRPLTPPLSPDTPRSQVIPIPAIKKKSNSPATRHSSGGSITYSPFPKTTSRPSSSRHSSPSNTLNSVMNATSSDNAGNGRGLVIEGASEAPSLEGIVNLSNTSETKVTTRSSPAVTHETITPQVHSIREEQITREIHTHDVLHRIQPIIDVEVLPAKHYVRNSTGGLIEIPASAVPGRQDHWQVEESPRTSTISSMSSDSVAPPPISGGRPIRNSVSARQDQPTMTSTRTSTMSSGGERTESIWRHPPTEETGGRETGQTVPLQVNRSDGASDVYGDSESSRSRRSEDSAFLFRDTGYGGGLSGYGGGMLPGLTERNPSFNPSTNESEATKALRKRQEDSEIRRGRQR